MTDDTGPYLRFIAMILSSMVVMFCLMYLHTYALDHVRWSETRFFMTLIMGGGMVLVMFSFMRGMYSNRKANIGLVAAGRGATVDDPGEILVQGDLPPRLVHGLAQAAAHMQPLRVEDQAGVRTPP